LVRWTVDDRQVHVGVNADADDVPDRRSTVDGPTPWH